MNIYIAFFGGIILGTTINKIGYKPMEKVKKTITITILILILSMSIEIGTQLQKLDIKLLTITALITTMNVIIPIIIEVITSIRRR